MQQSNITKRSNKVDYFIIFLMVAMSAGVSFLGVTIFRIVLLILVLSVLKIRKRQITFKKYFRLQLTFYLVWAILLFSVFEINFLKSGQLLTYLSFFSLLFAAYFSVFAINDFFKTYIKVIYHLALISFVFFIIQIIDFNLLLNILQIFDPINNYFIGSEAFRPNIVIFTYPIDAGYIIENSGFATEPGEFSVFLILALMLHLTINNCKIDKIVVVLFIATLTTFSTAGYLGLLAFILYYWYNKRTLPSKITLALVLVPLVLMLINLEFISEKISGNFQRETLNYERAYSQRITPGRFGSLLLDLNDVKENPLIGYGMHTKTRYINFRGIDQQRTNGLSDYLVKFGILGFLIMIFNYYKTSQILNKLNTTRGSYMLILGIFIVAFAQVILSTPLFFALQFYHFRNNH